MGQAPLGGFYPTSPSSLLGHWGLLSFQGLDTWALRKAPGEGQCLRMDQTKREALPAATFVIICFIICSANHLLITLLSPAVQGIEDRVLWKSQGPHPASCHLLVHSQFTRHCAEHVADFISSKLYSNPVRFLFAKEQTETE